MTTCEDMPYNVLTMRLLEALNAKKECIKVSEYTNCGYGQVVSGLGFSIKGTSIKIVQRRAISGLSNRANEDYEICINDTTYEINYIDGELMIKDLIQWYNNKLKQRKEQKKKQLLVDTIGLVENYKE